LIPERRTLPAVTEPRSIPQTRFQAPPGATEILLVRHGASEAAVEGVPFPLVDGHGDPALAPEGREQALQVAARLGREQIDAIYVSKLRRTTETAAPLAAALGLTPILDPDLHEVFLGEWEGGTFRHKVADGDPIAVRMFEEERWDVIPGAEPADDFADRARRAIGRIAAAHRDQRVVAVTHGAFIGEILHLATGSRPMAFMAADNTSISHLVVIGDRWMLRRFNDTGHLDDGLSATAAPLS
jgi:probable phosphoglycerate mutase